MAIAISRYDPSSEEIGQLVDRTRALLNLEYVTLTVSVNGTDTQSMAFTTWPTEFAARLPNTRDLEWSGLGAMIKLTSNLSRPADLIARAAQDPAIAKFVSALTSAGMTVPYLFPVVRHGRTLGCVLLGRAEPLGNSEELFFVTVAPGLHRLVTAHEESQGRNHRSLTPKELECLRWASLGKTSEETARLMGISPTTVETHFKNAATKLAVHNRVQTVADAMRLGWIS